MKRIKNANIKTKLFYISLSKLSIFVVIFLIILWSLFKNTEKWDEFQNKHIVSITALYSVHKNIGYNCGIHAFKNYLLRNEEFYYLKSKECFIEALSSLSEFEKVPTFKPDVEVIRNTIELYLLNLEKIKVALVENNFKLEDFDRNIQVDDGPAQEALTHLEKEILTRASHLKSEVESFQRELFYYMSALFLVGFFALLFMNRYLGNSIVRRIATLQDSAKNIADGDLDTKIYKTVDDEVGQLAKSLDRMRVKIKKYLHALESSNKELERFAFVTSHDLQEPLRKIISFGERLELSAASELGEDSKLYLEKILQSSVRMRNLIDDLLSYSRVSTQKKSFQKVDLNSVVRGVLSDLEISIQEAKAKIEVDLMPTVYADPMQMQQLFQNLLSNSLKFKKKSKNASISVTCDEPRSRMVKITIKDNGVGIDKKYYDRIFAPFQRLHSREEFEGTGIGLAICSKIVSRHGGKLDVQSKVDEGSSFSFDLQVI